MTVDLGREGLPFDILHRDEAHALRLADFVNVRDIRVVERRGGSGFATEPPYPLPISRHLVRQYLERDGAVEFCVAGAVDLAHPAFAQERNDLVMADGLAQQRLPIVSNEQRSSHSVCRSFDKTFGLSFKG